MKKIILFVLLFISTTMTFAENVDVIIKTNSEKIEAIIQVVTESEVRYRKASYPNGPIFILKKSQVASILYADGQTLVGMPSSLVEDTILSTDTITDISQSSSKLNLRHGITTTLSGIYYSGDIISIKNAFNYGLFTDQLGGSLSVNYKLTFNPYVSMRFGLQYSYIQGSNRKLKEKISCPLHEFKSSVLEPYVGVEFYPIFNYGFFIYSGIGLAASFYINYSHQRTAETIIYTSRNWNDIVGLVQMFKLGLGYNWWVTKNFTLGVELMMQIGLINDGRIKIDGLNYSIDGWPNRGGYNLTQPSQEIAYNKARFPDGWLQLGITASYNF